MNKKLRISLFIVLISLLFLTGCRNAEKEGDLHYKPSEFKHNVAIDKASRAIDDVNSDIIMMGTDTPADEVANTYKDSLTKLNEQLTNLENTKKLLSEDKDLTNSEVSNWNEAYNEKILDIKDAIKDVEKKQADFLK